MAFVTHRHTHTRFACSCTIVQRESSVARNNKQTRPENKYKSRNTQFSSILIVMRVLPPFLPLHLEHSQASSFSPFNLTNGGLYNYFNYNFVLLNGFQSPSVHFCLFNVNLYGVRCAGFHHLTFRPENCLISLQFPLMISALSIGLVA